MNGRAVALSEVECVCIGGWRVESLNVLRDVAISGFGCVHQLLQKATS